MYPVWSKNGHERFYENGEGKIMVLDYSVAGSSFVRGKARVRPEKELYYFGSSNLDLTPDGKRFVVMNIPEAQAHERARSTPPCWPTSSTS